MDQIQHMHQATGGGLLLHGELRQKIGAIWRTGTTEFPHSPARMRAIVLISLSTDSFHRAPRRRCPEVLRLSYHRDSTPISAIYHRDLVPTSAMTPLHRVLREGKCRQNRHQSPVTLAGQMQSVLPKKALFAPSPSRTAHDEIGRKPRSPKSAIEWKSP